MIPILLALLFTVTQPTALVLTGTTLEKVTGVQVSDITTTEASIAWKKQQGALKYQVWIRDANNQIVIKRKTERRRITITGLNPNTPYTGQVRAVRKTKTGAWSNQVEFTTAAETTTLYDDYKAIAGSSTGQWQNLTYGTSGDMTTTVEIDPDGQAAFTLDLGGLVFGLLDPDPKTFASTYDETGAVFIATDDDLFGDITITIIANDNDTAQITFTGVNVPIAGISSIAANGMLYTDSVDMNYTITFTDSFTAEGIINLTKLK